MGSQWLLVAWIKPRWSSQHGGQDKRSPQPEAPSPSSRAPPSPAPRAPLASPASFPPWLPLHAPPWAIPCPPQPSPSRLPLAPPHFSHPANSHPPCYSAAYDSPCRAGPSSSIQPQCPELPTGPEGWSAVRATCKALSAPGCRQSAGEMLRTPEGIKLGHSEVMRGQEEAGSPPS